MTPTEMGQRAAMTLLKAGASLPAAIVLGEVAKQTPDNVEVWAALGVAVARSVGGLVAAPFVHAATACFSRVLVLEPVGKSGDLARSWLAELERRPEYVDEPAMEPEALEGLLRFLDLSADVVPQGIDRLEGDDPMDVVMGVGDLASPRFVPVLAAAITGRWGDGAARSALKRVGPLLGAPEVREALAQARAGERAEELEPYLSWAEGQPVPRAPAAVVRGEA